MKQKFKANKGSFVVYLVITFLFPFVLFWNSEYATLPYFLLLIFLSYLPFLLFAWIYFSTQYSVDGTYLYYQSAFLKGKIDIQTIKSIQTNATLWSGTKPAMAKNGIIITYGYDEVYLAPVNNQQMIDALLQINPNIIIK